MLERLAFGELPRKHHLALRGADGRLFYEACLTRQGFDGPYSILYHQHRPQALRAVSADHVLPASGIGSVLQMLAHSSVGSGSMLGAARLVGLSRLIGHCCKRCESIDWSMADELLRTVRETLNAINAVRNRESIEAILSWQK